MATTNWIALAAWWSLKLFCSEFSDIPEKTRRGEKKGIARQWESFTLHKQTQQEIGDNLGVCFRNLQIVSEKSKSEDNLIKSSCDFMQGSSSLYVITLTGLVDIGIVVVEIKCF